MPLNTNLPRRKIIWMYWHNPFTVDDDEFLSEEKAEEMSPWDKEQEENKHSLGLRPVIPTPVGLIPVYPFQNFGQTFQFWLGHTNFDISRKVKESIENVPGVEILDIITRYCFRIAVGKAFVSREVKDEIQRILNAVPPKHGELNPHDLILDSDTKERVAIIKNLVKEKFSYWAIYVIPNGEIDVAGSNDKEVFDEEIYIYKEAQNIAGGIIYQYV